MMERELSGHSSGRLSGFCVRMLLTLAAVLFFLICPLRFSFSPGIISASGEEESSSSGNDYPTVYKGQDYSKVYNYSYYLKKYPSVAKKVGKDPEKVLKNFVKTGIKKGRRGCAGFRVKSYIYGNPDLRKKYGNNLRKYYLHYQNKGYKSKKRTATAVKIRKMVSPAVKYDGVSYSKVYDYTYYLSKHPEVKKLYGYDDTKVLQHYVENGFPAGERAKENVTDKAFETIRKNVLRKVIAGTDTASKTDQIILVIDHSLSLWEKNAKGTWKRKLNVYCGYGKNGLSLDRTEGDNTTPIGSFPILFAFGKAANPGTSMTWRDITQNSYWSGESATYNTWVESTRWVAGEHLTDYYQYKYAMAIGFNRDPVIVGKGSAIFLHCKSVDHWYTGGCVSVEENVMRKLLLKCRNGTYIIIVRDSQDVASY